MLQQTQVSVVIPYFERWMESFPTIASLARAPLEHVIKLWEGLGYYSRARNLHEAAHMIVDNYEGEIPSDPFELQKMKGLGPYTIGALRSFAFRQKAAAVDGNVIRVLSRFFAIEEHVDTPKTVQMLWQKAEAILPEEQPWLITEGLIELGALVCKKEPSCLVCPLRTHCLGYRQGLQCALPKKRKKQQITILHRLVGVVVCEEHVLLQKGEKGKVMSDLYEFPYVDTSHVSLTEEEIASLFSTLLQQRVSYRQALQKQTHGFTRYRVHLFPHLLQVEAKDSHQVWVEKSSLMSLPFSSGHRRILATLDNL